MYSGRHPAITPLTATFQTVAAARLGCMMPSTSSGERSVNFRNSSTFSRVGGTTGSPSRPPIAQEVLVHLLERAGEHDVALAGLPGSRPAFRPGFLPR